MPKSVRDELYDIIAQVTTFSAETEHQSVTEDAPSATANRMCQCLLELEKNWEHSLPQTQHKLNLDVSAGEECHIDLDDREAIDTVLLKLEFVTARLLFALLSIRYADSPDPFEHIHLDQENRARRILALPIFHQHHNRSAGILESHCRSLFTIWVLRQLQT